MSEMKTLTLGTKMYEVVDEVARSQGGGDVVVATEYNRINVRDYGAVGDGVTDDQPAIWAAITAAKELIAQDIPCELYFPAGTYGILNGGFGITLPRGKGGLRITGAGREVTTIKYLPKWKPSSAYGSQWYAIDVSPVGEGVTGNYDTYIHDVSITGLTVYDPDPCAHAIHPDKGDSDKEENHGVNIGWCLRASVTECQFISVGDEAIDIYSCNDAVVMNNHCVGSPGAGTAGGAISICDGSVGVLVIGNTVNGSALDETLDNGTVIEKGNSGIALESLGIPVRDVVVANNTIRNIQGNGINLGATNSGSGFCNILIEGNVIQGCNNGISDEGQFQKEFVSIHNNIISDCVSLRKGFGSGIYFEFPGFVNASIFGNKIRNTDACGIYARGIDTIIDGNDIENTGDVAIFIGGSATVRNCIIKDTVGGAAPISCLDSAVYTVSGCRISGARQEKGIIGATEVEGTTISFVDADGNAVTNRKVIDSSHLKRLVNCQLNGYMFLTTANTLVEGVTLNCGQQWQPAFKVIANGVIITGCHITAQSGRDAILEESGRNGNLFANNIVNRPITVVGAQSVAVNNIDTRNVT